MTDVARALSSICVIWYNIWSNISVVNVSAPSCCLRDHRNFELIIEDLYALNSSMAFLEERLFDQHGLISSFISIDEAGI